MSFTIIAGFVLGILSALFFTFYMVPQKVTKVDHTTFLWTMGLGVLLTSLVPYALVGFPHHSTLLHKGAGILCGAVWGIGTLSLAASIRRIGLALATPIKNTTGVLGTLVGLVFFQEWKTTDPVLGVTGSLLIVVAAILIGQTGSETVTRRHTVTGVFFALLAASCYASYLYPLKMTVRAIGYWEFTPWMALGILLTATVATVLRPGGVRDIASYPLRVYGICLLGGVSWGVALFCLAASMVMVDLSVAWALAQLNTIPAVFLGGLVFREVDLQAHRRMIFFGLLAATLGTFCLGFAK